MRIRKKRGNVSPRMLKKVKIRKTISGTAERPRLSVFRSSKHIYVQIISDVSGTTLVGLSTLDKEVLGAVSSISREGLHNDKVSTKSVAAAKALGMIAAKRAAEKNIKSVVFDRSGYQYMGRVKAVADGAREAGLNF